MKHFGFIIAIPVLLFIAGCGGPKEDPTPEVLKISPARVTSEPGNGHEIQFKVTCDKAFESAIDNAPWATISSSTEDGNGSTIIKIMLSANITEEERSGKLVITAGKKSIEGGFSQLPASKLFPTKAITLKDTNPETLSVRLPDNWTISCEDTNGKPVTWFTATPSEGQANIMASVVFQADLPNFGEETLNGIAVIKCGDLVFKVTVTQEVSTILGKTYGLFNYDKKGTNIAYEPLAHQVSVLRRTDGTQDFRMIAPGQNKFLLVRGLPANLKAGDSVSFTLFQNWTKNLEYTSQVNAQVYRVDDKMIWILDGDVCYVVMK
ncbi:MAG: BACON domain-containing protein [Bacteroidales bacterium]|nr:BACON domain-containing protein [Bacteroidales bacterium]